MVGIRALGQVIRAVVAIERKETGPHAGNESTTRQFLRTLEAGPVLRPEDVRMTMCGPWGSGPQKQCGAQVLESETRAEWDLTKG